MNRPTCDEIAMSKELWNEYVDANGAGGFDKMTRQERLDTIHELWPQDCNCGELDEE